MSASLCAPHTKWMSTRGLQTREPERVRRILPNAPPASERDRDQRDAEDRDQSQQHDSAHQAVMRQRDRPPAMRRNSGPYGDSCTTKRG